MTLPIVALLCMLGSSVVTIVGVWRSTKILNRFFWVGIIVFAVALSLMLIGALTNKQLINSTISDDFKTTKQYQSEFVAYDMPTNWATTTSNNNTYFYPSRTVGDDSLGMVMVRSDLTVFNSTGFAKSVRKASKDYVALSDSDGTLGRADTKTIVFRSTISGEAYTTEMYIVHDLPDVTSFSFVFKGDTFPTHFRDSVTKIINSADIGRY